MDPDVNPRSFIDHHRSIDKQETLAPALLLLYGDVEHTGHYDKLEHRFHIAAVLKYLWQSPEHRSVRQSVCL